jgi:hypothetical protein
VVLGRVQADSVNVTPWRTVSNGYHGGKSTGAKNPRVKHGFYTKAAIEERKMINLLLLKTRSTIAGIE